jgi:hypothetical protein
VSGDVDSGDAVKWVANSRARWLLLKSCELCAEKDKLEGSITSSSPGATMSAIFDLDQMQDTSLASSPPYVATIDIANTFVSATQASYDSLFLGNTSKVDWAVELSVRALAYLAEEHVKVSSKSTGKFLINDDEVAIGDTLGIAVEAYDYQLYPISRMTSSRVVALDLNVKLTRVDGQHSVSSTVTQGKLMWEKQAAQNAVGEVEAPSNLYSYVIPAAWLAENGVGKYTLSVESIDDEGSVVGDPIILTLQVKSYNNQQLVIGGVLAGVRSPPCYAASRGAKRRGRTWLAFKRKRSPTVRCCSSCSF